MENGGKTEEIKMGKMWRKGAKLLGFLIGFFLTFPLALMI